MPLGLQGGTDSLRRAYQAVHADPLVETLLEDEQTQSLSLAARVTGQGVETTKFQHYYKGVEVVGSMTFHHESTSGVEVRNLLSQFDLETRPTLTAEQAVAIAKAAAGDYQLVSLPELKILPTQDVQGSARLIYWVDLANDGLKPGADVIVDAQSGRVIGNISKLKTIAPIQVVTAKNHGIQVQPVGKRNEETKKVELVGCLINDLDKGVSNRVSVSECKEILRGESSVTRGKCQLIQMLTPKDGDPKLITPAFCEKVVTDGVASGNADTSAVNALNNAKAALTYYKEVHGRDGFDNAGSEVVSVVHVGINHVNAGWMSGQDFMLYGDGDGEVVADMTTGLDVAGHELTHGISSKTAHLIYMDQSGALDEAYADFFGKMIAKDGSWKIGQSLSLDPAKFSGLRDLSNPAVFKERHPDASGKIVEKTYPSKVSESEKRLADTECKADNDHCWVHFNTTIPGHASYLIYNAIGAEKAQTLYYLTMTQYLTSDANFAKAATATLSACKARFDATTCAKVKAAFVQTEMLKD